MDWKVWHDRYQTDPELKARLEQVITFIDEALLAMPPGKVNVLSICCGDARDLLAVLPTHPRRADVSGWLLDTNECLIHKARKAVLRRGLAASLFPCVADVTLSQSYDDIPPAQLIVLAGVFGSVEPDEIPRLLKNIRVLCAPSAWVIWTKNIQTPEGYAQAETIQREFANQSFTPVKSATTPQKSYHVWLYQNSGLPGRRQLDERLFTFGLRRYTERDSD